MIKKFWVCAWYTYYPSGGLGNVRSTCETQEEAEAEVARLSDPMNYGYDFVKIYDVSDMIGLVDQDSY